MLNNFSLRRKTIGFIFMIFGLIIILYPLTNMSWNEYKAAARYEMFNKNHGNVTESEIRDFNNFADEYNYRLGKDSGKIIDPFAYSDYKVDYGLDKFDKNKVFGYIKIDKIDAKKPIRFDASYENLSRGVAHVDGTSLPVGGLGTRSVIAGHRGWYTDVMFLNLHKLEAGDLVEVELVGGKVLKYVVKDKEIIDPSQHDKISPIANKDMLTLLTCDPMVPPSPKRLLVNCERLVEGKTYVHEVKDATTQISYINYTKYGIYVVTTIIWTILFGILLRFAKYLRSNK